jgi:hypothetical protein
MTIFGNRDSGYGSSPAAGSGPSPESFDSLATPPATQPATSARGFGAPDNRRVILRVHGDDDILVGRAEGRENAVQIARDMVRHIEQASAKGEWPQIDERFIRPGAIVSVDVQRPE